MDDRFLLLLSDQDRAYIYSCLQNIEIKGDLAMRHVMIQQSLQQAPKVTSDEITAIKGVLRKTDEKGDADGSDVSKSS